MLPTEIIRRHLQTDAAELRINMVWGCASYEVTPTIVLTGALYRQDVKNLPASLRADPMMYVAKGLELVSTALQAVLAAPPSWGRLIAVAPSDR